MCLKGTRSNPNILFFCAQGMARRVNRFPTPPNMAKKMHLKIQNEKKLDKRISNLQYSSSKTEFWIKEIAALFKLFVIDIVLVTELCVLFWRARKWNVHVDVSTFTDNVFVVLFHSNSAICILLSISTMYKYNIIYMIHMNEMFEYRWNRS